MTPRELRQTLADLGIQPRKSLGQHFLVDANNLRILIEQADLRRDDVVLEIGPGLGMLTAELLKQAQQVVAIEKDRQLCQYLRKRFPGLTLLEGDALGVLDSEDCPAFTKVVANLPYNISTPVLERLVEGTPKPRQMVLTLQREVGERLAATPRHKGYGALSVWTQLHYHPEIAHRISPSCFYPPPRVQSAVVVLWRRDPRISLEADAPFHEIVRQGFQQRRKMLKNLLTDRGNLLAGFERAGIPATARAEELSLEDWIRLANALRA